MSPRFPEAATSERGGVPGRRDRERDFPKLHRMTLTTTQVEISREPEEVRHLREFSNFLSPKIGFFKSEMWNAIMAEARTAISITSSLFFLDFAIGSFYPSFFADHVG